MKTRCTLWGVCAATVLLLAGCATGGGGGGAAPGPSDEELIQNLMGEVMGALAAQDVDKMMMSYADDFTSDQGGKDAMQQFLAGAKEQGFLEGIEVDLEGASINVEGDKAMVDSVAVAGAFGSLSLGFELEKRDGTWIITSQTQSQ